MKILLISKTSEKGGSASGVLNLYTALESTGHEVILQTADKLRFDKKIMRILEYICNKLIFGKGTHFFKFYYSSLNVLKLVDQFRPDIIQLCNISENCIDLGAVKSLNVPTVHRLSDFWPYHGPHHYGIEPYGGFWSKPAFNLFNGTLVTDFASVVVAPSSWTKSKLKLKGKSKDNLKLIPNAVSVNENIASKGFCKDRTLRLGIVIANLETPRKGVRNLVNALESLTWESKIELRVFGKGVFPKLFNENIQVYEMGAFSREQIQFVYSCFDILLFPSLLENSANTITEAFSNGVPVIAQDGTGNDYYVRRDVGRLVDFRNKADNYFSLRSALVDIINDYETFSRSAVKAANERFSPQVIGKKYTKIYKKLIEKV